MFGLYKNPTIMLIVLYNLDWFCWNVQKTKGLWTSGPPKRGPPFPNHTKLSICITNVAYKQAIFWGGQQLSFLDDIQRLIFWCPKTFKMNMNKSMFVDTSKSSFDLSPCQNTNMISYDMSRMTKNPSGFRRPLPFNARCARRLTNRGRRFFCPPPFMRSLPGPAFVELMLYWLTWCLVLMLTLMLSWYELGNALACLL